MSRLSDQIAREAVQHTVDAMKAGAFDDAIDRAIASSVRSLPDRGINRTGFMLKMAVELVDRSCPRLSLTEAQRMAHEAYSEFSRDNKVRFGTPGWDWSGTGARSIAQAYVIDYWEPCP